MKVKCQICGFEAQNKKELELHLKEKHPNANGESSGELDPRYATKEDLNKINGSLEKLTEILTKPPKSVSDPAMAIQKPPAKDVKLEKDPEKPESVPVPPKWRAMVDEVLGTDFGINLVYPDQGSGFLFKIIVPLEKSNAAKDYLELYKVDIRTKAISYQDGIEGVRKFCELVKINLQRNK